MAAPAPSQPCSPPCAQRALQGIEPLATVAHDLTAPVAAQPLLRLTLTNVLNRPVQGTLAVTLGGLTLEPLRLQHARLRAATRRNR